MAIKSAKHIGDSNRKDDDREIEIVRDAEITEVITLSSLKEQIADIDAQILNLLAKRKILDDKLKDVIKKL